MVQYRRNFVPGGTYFFTVALANRESSALVHHVDALRTAFRVARRERPFAIDAIVILPDHLHAIWTLPSGDADFSGRWKRIKARFTHQLVSAGTAVVRQRNGEFGLWQRRFWEHTIRNDVDFERHVDYVHFNPVKHGHVSQIRDWPYSSFHLYARRGLLPSDWAGDADEPEINFGERKA
jgi:putative transposase